MSEVIDKIWNPIIIPIPDGISFNFIHKDLGKPMKYWAYHNENGQLIGYICRWDTKFGKDIRPVCYTRQGWRCCGFPKPWKLYNLHLIYKYPELPILICEGEKSADAGTSLFKDVICTTSMHGVQSVHNNDWSPLKDRDVIICADIDEAGIRFRDAVKNECKCARSISFLDLTDIQKELNSENIKGFDLGDAYELGWNPPDLYELLTDPPFNPNDVISDDFFIKDNSIYYHYYNKENKESEERRLCSYLIIKYKTRDLNGDNWGALFEMRDSDNRLKELTIPAEMLAGDCLEVRQILLQSGVTIEPGKNKLFNKYLLSLKPKKHIQCVGQTGWSEDSYVLPHKTYQFRNREEIRLQRNSTVFIKYQKKGSLEDWNNCIGRYAENNINITFIISLALTAPLLAHFGMENIAIHLFGPSSIGKTTLLKIASSVWGSVIHNWRTTDNAAESVAELSNDGMLLLDELGQVSPSAADQLSYMLGNGLGKLRSKRSGDAKEAKKFNLVLLSSGESGLSDKLKEIGKTVKAGQSVRLIELSADREYGIFDNLHGFQNGDKFARYLKESCTSNQGSLIDSFLEILVKNKDSIIDMVKNARNAWEQLMILKYPDADGQVQRIISKFSLIAACGELAISLNLLAWKEGEVLNSCDVLLEKWINSRGGLLAQEILESSRNLQEFMEEYGSSRFEDAWSDVPKIVPNRAGFKRLVDDGNERLWEYYLLPTAFNKIIGSVNKSDICNYLKSKGILEAEEFSGKNAKSIRVSKLGKKRLYHINCKKLEFVQ